MTRRSNQRFTVTIGIDVDRARGRDDWSRARAAAPVRTAVRSANHGTASTTCGASIRSPRTSTPRTRPCSTTTRASAFSRTSPPRASMKSRAGSAYIWCSGFSRQHERGCGRVGPEHLGQDADERRRCGHDRATDSAPRPPAVPTASRGASGAARVRVSHSDDRAGGHAPTTVPSSGAAPLRARGGAPPASCAAKRSRHGIASQSRTAGQQMQRRRKRRTAKDGAPPVACRGTPPPSTAASRTFLERIDAPQEVEGLAVAAEQHVLPVVDQLAGVRDRRRPWPGRRAAAARRARARARPARRAARRRSGRRIRRRRSTTSGGRAGSRRVLVRTADPTDSFAAHVVCRNQRTLRPWDADDAAEHVVVGGFDPVEDAAGRSPP